MDGPRSRWQRGAVLAGLSVVALAAVGCSRTDSSDNREGERERIEASEPASTPIAEPDAPLPAQEPAAAPPLPSENSSVAIPPDEPTPPDLQVQDDADAVGMTARLPRGDQAEPPVPADPE